MITSTESEIQFLELKSSDPETFKGMISYLEMSMSKVVLGSTMTTDSGGSYSQSQVHENSTNSIFNNDAEKLQKTLQRDVIEPFVIYNFGEQKTYPRLKLAFNENDIVRKATVISMLARTGMKIGQSNLYEQFNLDQPQRRL